MDGRRTGAARPIVVAALVALAAVVGGCARAPVTAGPFTPGTPEHPRAVIVIARDYTFEPPVVDLVPGETVVLQVVNGGLEIHEAVVGPPAVQDAWEAAEAATVGTPPGPTAAVSVPPDIAGLRVVVPSGGRRDATLTVPANVAGSGPGAAPWSVGCHIPGHWALGMVVPIRFVDAHGDPIAPTSAPDP